MSAPPVTFITVTRNGFFFTRLLIEKLRHYTRDRDYEIIVVDRRSSDGTRAWMRQQADVRLLTYGQWWTRGHGHGEAAEYAVRKAKYERIVLLDSDAHPVRHDWLAGSVDRLDDHNRLAGAVFTDKHRGNPHGWFIHPHFMTFFKSDLGGLIVLRKVRGEDTDTGEEATIRVLEAGKGVIRLPLEFCAAFDVGHPNVPTKSGGVFHAWYVSRLESDEADVIRETEGRVSRAKYSEPLQAKLRAAYALDY